MFVRLFNILSGWYTLEFKISLAGTGYPTGKITHAGTGMGRILYPSAYMGSPTFRFFLWIRVSIGTTR